MLRFGTGDTVVVAVVGIAGIVRALNKLWVIRLGARGIGHNVILEMISFGREAVSYGGLFFFRLQKCFCFQVCFFRKERKTSRLFSE